MTLDGERELDGAWTRLRPPRSSRCSPWHRGVGGTANRWSRRSGPDSRSSSRRHGCTSGPLRASRDGGPSGLPGAAQRARRAVPGRGRPRGRGRVRPCRRRSAQPAPSRRRPLRWRDGPGRCRTTCTTSGRPSHASRCADAPGPPATGGPVEDAAGDPTDEQAHLAIVEQHRASGDLRAALRQLERLDQALRREPGTVASPSVERLRADLSTRSMPRSGSQSGVRLYGRKEIGDRLRARLELAAWSGWFGGRLRSAGCRQDRRSRPGAGAGGQARLADGRCSAVRGPGPTPRCSRRWRPVPTASRAAGRPRRPTPARA